MKKLYHIINLTALLAASCSQQELESTQPMTTSREVFYAQMEDAPGKETRVFADEMLRVLWDEDDHISIFNKNTAGMEYRFTGMTGDNAGTFHQVGQGNAGSGNAMELVYAVYPYREGTTASSDGILSITLPNEQRYREGTFGLGDNTMVSCSIDNRLLFKNLCGYLMLKFYGENVSISSISLMGNKGEPLAGTATVTTSVDGSPALTLGAGATSEITLAFDNPVTLGTTAETASVFWLVVPPTSFDKGVTVTVKDELGGVFRKTTTNSLRIDRNNLVKMSAVDVRTEDLSKRVLHYTSTDGKPVSPNAPEAFGVNIVSNEYAGGQGTLTFDGNVSSIGAHAFENCLTLAGITIPEYVTSIGESALAGCTGLESITTVSDTPATGASAMFDNTNDCPILVPLKSTNSYRTAEFWSQYADRISVQGVSVTQYMVQTKGEKPMDLCIISEGFTKNEKDKFLALAAEGVDYMFDTEPFKTYKDYFNVYFLSVPSQDSGASITDGNGTITVQKNTAFNARWGQDTYSDLAADEDAIFGFVSAYCPEIANGTLSINDVPVAMIINDTRFGGICHSYSDGRGYAMIPHTSDGGQLAWSINNKMAAQDEPVTDGNYYYRLVSSSELDAIGRTIGNWKNIFLHEFGGHCFSRFKDEYWYDSYYTAQSTIWSHTFYPVPYGLNVSGYHDSTPWDSLLEIRDNLVTVDGNYERIGKYQGADVSMFNRWRSEIVSCMIDNRPYFSTWQRILIVRRIMEKAGMEFSAEEFFDKDVTLDPIRDKTSSFILGYDPTLPIQEVPLLPPPVLIDTHKSF